VSVSRGSRAPSTTGMPLPCHCLPQASGRALA
jgi:hypothetical protein